MTERIEITGLRGIPEALLSDALAATLPENLSEAPWECRCVGLLWTGRGGRSAAAALPQALAGSSALGVVGGFVRYQHTPVGTYDEVLGMVGSRDGVRPWGSVAFMAVDSPSSLVGGRTNWAMPKTLARFDGDIGAGRTFAATSADGLDWHVQATPKVLGPAVPLKSKAIAKQQFADGRIGSSLLEFSGRVRPALVTVEVESQGPLASWLRPGRHLGGVVESATFTLGEPRFD